MNYSLPVDHKWEGRTTILPDQVNLHHPIVFVSFFSIVDLESEGSLFRPGNSVLAPSGLHPRPHSSFLLLVVASTLIAMASP